MSKAVLGLRDNSVVFPVDIKQLCPYCVSIVSYSSGQVARKIGVDKKTLLRWLYANKLAEPEIIKTAGMTIRVWREADLHRAARYKRQNYCKGRGRKKMV